MKDAKKINIVMVDDDREDAFLIGRALSAIDVDVNFEHVADSEVFVNSISTSSNAYEATNMLLVDLNMPSVDGFDVIRAVRANEQFKKTKIVMLTSSSRDEDRKRAVALGADEFATKPNSSRDTLELMASFFE